ncbi:MAG: recombinase family protein [Magnetococcales bacterium]|nr:recombinase family protein [Magnetococcales bacterium]
MKKKMVIPKVRCAIYTRKSTNDGLEMEFNSLDSQVDSCTSYIASQKAEGWLVVQDQYDDGGFSGGSLERPALKRLMADIEAGRIDCVVVYKIDRLTRSLMDFSKLVEIFDRCNVTFVSVTQHFNTTSSMGRLTLNILLSFSQFERELAAERIRDKIATSRRRGIWMGGYAPLGYDVRNRKLILNEQEADLIRHIFKRFTQLGSSTTLAMELNAAGHHTKAWTTQSGRVRKGKPFDKGSLYHILNNQVYIGMATHKEESFPGEHEAIISQAIWGRVKTIMAANAPNRASGTRSQTPASLKGIIRCGHCDRSMKPSHTKKKGRLYRYYTCMAAAKTCHDICPVKSVAAGEIEQVVLDQLRTIIQTPEMVAKTWRAANRGDERVSERDIVNALQNLEPVWDALFPGEQSRLLQLLVGKVEVRTDGIEMHLLGEGLDTLVRDLRNNEEEMV